MTEGRIVQVIPAEGWRAVYATDPGPDVDIDENPYVCCEVVPLVCWALVKPWDEREHVARVVGLTVQDMPSYVYEAEDPGSHVTYLGPGQQVDKQVAREAVGMVRRVRKQMAAAS